MITNYPEGAENDPLAPWNRIDGVDYLGRAVQPEEFEEEDTRILCEGCGQVEVKKDGYRCEGCKQEAEDVNRWIS